jgi:Protein of unknown function (DUF3800)
VAVEWELLTTNPAAGVKLPKLPPGKPGFLIFERMVNRINRTMAEWKSNALIVHDEGKDYTSLIRRMGVYNPIRSKYNCWPDGEEFRNFPTDRILEDIFFRKSHKSDLIQMADFCAYALFRSEFPLPSKTRFGLHIAFEALHPICVKAAFSRDPKRPHSR